MKFRKVLGNLLILVFSIGLNKSIAQTSTLDNFKCEGRRAVSNEVEWIYNKPLKREDELRGFTYFQDYIGSYHFVAYYSYEKNFLSVNLEAPSNSRPLASYKLWNYKYDINPKERVAVGGGDYIVPEPGCMAPYGAPCSPVDYQVIVSCFVE